MLKVAVLYGSRHLLKGLVIQDITALVLTRRKRMVREGSNAVLIGPIVRSSATTARDVHTGW